MAIQSGAPGSPPLSPERTAQVRTRVRLLIDITARAGSYRRGLIPRQLDGKTVRDALTYLLS